MCNGYIAFALSVTIGKQRKSMSVSVYVCLTENAKIHKIIYDFVLEFSF